MRLPVSEPSRASLLHAIRVLVVDDEPEVCEAMRHLLSGGAVIAESQRI